ncbi:MAG: CHAT domain-containing protein, partial [Blastocatellia bacterium]
IGLGEMGELSADVIRRGVTAAALQYALDVLEGPIAGQPDARPNARKDAKKETAQKAGSAAPGYRSAAFSTLLIGTYGGTAIRVKESAAAILQGAMQTNRILQEQGLWDFVRIDEVEFIELYEDVAIRAIRAIYEAEDLKTSDVAKGVTVKVLPATLRTVGGGRYQRPASEIDTYWYSRIQITASDDGSGDPSRALMPRLPKIFALNPGFRAAHRAFVEQLIEEATKTPRKRADLADMVVDLMQGKSSNKGSGSLMFEVLTDRARIEASMQATQRQLVDWMVEQTVNTTRYDQDLSISLFELLIPNALKERTDNVVLQLDREAAQYPWELMTERAQADRPLATRMGILRQFKTDDFRANPRPSRGNTALVIGDTAKSGLAELPGAQEEAKAVAQLLKKDEMYVAVELIKSDGKKIVNELFAREYQILHIAAHGNFNKENPDQSGVVLDDGRFLTAKELVNLRTIPDLVFINCCHLGKMERLITEYPNRLAASIAEELIKMGVKAVVAAGWAVDDAAAVTFARMFYASMLAGDSFGEAVLKARIETHREHSDKNTWGAYQCYGNPNFRLNLRGTLSGKPDGRYSRREYRDALRSIASIVDAQNVKRNESHRKDLLKIEKDMPREMLLDGEVLSDFGEAWFTLGNFEEAITFYDRAIRTDDAKAALKSVERLANLHSRHAIQLWEMHRTRRSRADSPTVAGADQVAEIRKKINNAGRILDWLILPEEADALFPGGNSERFSLRGKVYKCESLIADSKEERETKLAKARESYHSGYLWAKKQNEQNDCDRKDFIFPAVNVVACGLLSPEPDREDLQGIIEECRKALDEGLLMGSIFWTRVARAELNLLEHLLEGNLAEQEPDEIVEGYVAAIDGGWNPSDAESVLWQWHFLITILASEGRPEKDAASARALSMIRAKLLQSVDAKSR